MVWVGNDDNKPTGLYGATGAMRVWSGIFSRLPSASLKVGDKGLDRQWVVSTHSTDAGCPGARRFAFVAGFAPAYQRCVYADPDPYQQQGEDGERGGWREWFGWGDEEAPRDPATQVPPAEPPAPVEEP